MKGGPVTIREGLQTHVGQSQCICRKKWLGKLTWEKSKPEEPTRSRRSAHLWKTGAFGRQRNVSWISERNHCWTARKRRAFGRCGKSSRWNTSSHCSRHRRRHRRHLHRHCPRHTQRTYWRHNFQRCNRPAQKRRIRRRRW